MDRKPYNPHNKIIAQEHNKNNYLINLSQDALGNIILSHNSIEDSIKTILSLTTTCTDFQNHIPYMGKALRSFPQEERNNAMKLLQSQINDPNYIHKRRALSLLIHAQAEHNQKLYYPLLQRIVHSNDTEMAELLFQYGANANELDERTPIWFGIEGLPMLNIFIKNKVDFKTKNHCGYTIVWYSIKVSSKASKKLFQYYLKHAFSPDEIDEDGNYITHEVAKSTFSRPNLKLLDILLFQFPELVNKLNKQHKTPLDIALSDEFVISEPIKALFKKHGAKRSEELQAAKNEIDPELNCCVCFESNNLIHIPCSNKHSDLICTTCNNQLRKNKCPLCRNNLT